MPRLPRFPFGPGCSRRRRGVLAPRRHRHCRRVLGLSDPPAWQGGRHRGCVARHQRAQGHRGTATQTLAGRGTEHREHCDHRCRRQYRVREQCLCQDDGLQSRGSDWAQPAHPAIGQDPEKDVPGHVGGDQPRPPLEGYAVQPPTRRDRVCRARGAVTDPRCRRAHYPLCCGQGGHHRETACRRRAEPVP